VVDWRLSWEQRNEHNDDNTDPRTSPFLGIVCPHEQCALRAMCPSPARAVSVHFAMATCVGKGGSMGWVCGSGGGVGVGKMKFLLAGASSSGGLVWCRIQSHSTRMMVTPFRRRANLVDDKDSSTAVAPPTRVG
jgi:hypothetical protein